MNLQRLAERVPLDTDLPERVAHARDLWPRGTLAMAHGARPVAPVAVAFPRNEGEIVDVLRWAVEEGVPVIPYGAGSGVCGAAAGANGALAVDLKRMRNIGRVDPESRTVVVDPGVLGQHLEDDLEAQGWATRHSPSSIWCSTVGGWAASRSAGQFSSKYGKFEDMVTAMRVVTPRRIYTTGAWLENGGEGGGDDLGPWVMGSEGALGIISSLQVRVVPYPKARWLRGYRFASLEAAWEAMRKLVQAELHPAALRLYDPVDTRLAGKGTVKKEKTEGRQWLAGFGEEVKQRPALRRHLASLPLALPRLMNRIVRQLAHGCVLIAGWEGEPAPVDVLSREGHRLLLASGGEDLGAEPGEHWYRSRHEVSYKLAPIFAMGGFADTMEVAALWSKLPGLFAAVEAAIGRHGIVMSHFSHVYPEGCSIYFSFAGVGELDVYDALWKDALEAAAAAGGTVAHHHGVGQLKMAAAGRELAGARPLFLALKAKVDPAGILNPGRLFPERPAAEGELPEPPAPALGIDATSRVATLSANADPALRDAQLAAEGWALRFPTAGPLTDTIRGPQEPWETRVVGASVHLPSGRAVFLAVPRSAAGPDPRRFFAAGDYETLTVPIVPLDEPAETVSADLSACLRQDLRPTRTTPEGLEFRGPAAAEIAALARGVLLGPDLPGRPGSGAKDGA